MQLRRPVTLLVAAAAFAGVAAPASAGEYIVRPAQTQSSGPWVVPAGSTAHETLADPVVDPTVPDTSGGYLSTTSTSGGADLVFAAPSIPAGETITRVKVRAYIAGGSRRSVSFNLRSGSAVLGFGYVSQGTPASWQTTTSWVKPTASHVADMHLSLSADGFDTSTDARVYAAYAVVTTSPATGVTDPGATGTDGSTSTLPGTDSGSTDGGGATTGGGEPDLEQILPVSLPATPLTATPGGVLAVPITCQLAGGCTGTITTRLISERANSSRRRKAVKAKPRKARFRLKPGQSKTVPVRLDRRTKRVIRSKRRANIAVTVAVDGSAPVTKQVTVVQRRNSGRRR